VCGGGYIFATWPVFYFGKFSQPSKEKEKEGAKGTKGLFLGGRKWAQLAIFKREIGSFQQVANL
jgi:hypothetical protein